MTTHVVGSTADTVRSGYLDPAASDRDADTYARLFTEDAVLDGAQGRHAGRDALRASAGPAWAAEGQATLHLTLNPVTAITQTLTEQNGLWLISSRTVAPVPGQA